MVVSLAANIHAAWLDGGVVLLDVARDSYLCLPIASGGQTHSAFEDLPGETIDVLVAQRLLVHEDRANSTPAPKHGSADPGSIEDMDAPITRRFTKGQLIRFARALLHASLHFRKSSFDQLLALARKGAPVDPTTFDPIQYAAEVAAFDHLTLCLPFRIQCLFRSFMLLRFLRAGALDADWVFGVGLYPFRAHCWLQRGTVLVGDHRHVVLAYQPILRVGATAQ